MVNQICPGRKNFGNDGGMANGRHLCKGGSGASNELVDDGHGNGRLLLLLLLVVLIAGRSCGSR